MQDIDKAGKYIRVAFSVGEKTFANNAFEQGFLKLKQQNTNICLYFIDKMECIWYNARV